MWEKRWETHCLEKVKQGQSVLPVQNPETERQVHKCTPQERSDSHYPLGVLWAPSHLGKCWCPLLEKNQTTHLVALCTAVADCQADWVQGRLVWHAHLSHSIPIPERIICWWKMLDFLLGVTTWFILTCHFMQNMWAWNTIPSAQRWNFACSFSATQFYEEHAKTHNRYIRTRDLKSALSVSYAFPATKAVMHSKTTEYT